jgi:hypothetical protein
VPKVLAFYPCLNLRLTFRRITSALGERDDRYFRLAAKAKRQGDCTNAPVDIELRSIAQPEQSVHVLDTHLRKEQWRQQGEKNLSSVGMSGEYEVNLPGDGIVRKIGLVCQQDHRFMSGSAG